MPRGLPLFALKMWLFGLFGSLGTPAFAQDVEFWRAPPGCPSAQQADRALRKLGEGDSAFARGQARVVIDTAPTGELRARVELGSQAERDQRTLLAHDCKALTEAALLVIALASTEGESQARTGSGGYASDAHAPSVDTHGSLRSQRDEKWARKWGLGAMSHVDNGSLPHATWGLGANLWLDWHRTHVSLEVSYFGARVKALPEGEAGGVEVGLVRAALQACYVLYGPHAAQSRVSLGTPSFAPCIALEQGMSRGRGMGLVDSQQRTGAWSSAVLGLAVALHGFGIVRPIVRVDVGARLRSPNFEVQGVGSVFHASPWFLRGSLGVLVELN